MNILNLRKVIYDFLITKQTRTFYEVAPENTAFPYVTFNLASSFANLNQVGESFRLEVDVWDNVLSTVALDTLVGQIDGDGAIVNASGLHRKHINNSKVQADFYREARLSIPDEDERIKRRKLIYEVEAYLISDST